MINATDEQFMRQALKIARRGIGAVEPNPPVGAVVVKKNKIVGQGWHRAFGQAHAEVEALSDAGPNAKGSTVYVTLEPCCHYGQTPPCSRSLVDAQVKRVVIGVLDPTPARRGVGVAELEAVGIQVDVGAVAEEAAELVRPFVKITQTGLPWVIGKWAATVDGAMATRSGDSQWISSEASRHWVHQLRARVDGIVVGIGTVLADDPLLTARGVKRKRVADRIVIDPSLKLPVDSQLVQTIDQGPVVVIADQHVVSARGRRWQQLAKAGVEIVGARRSQKKSRQPKKVNGQSKKGSKKSDGPLLLRPVLRRRIKQSQWSQLMIEGGGRTMGQWVDQGLVDQLEIFMGPKLLGQDQAVHPVLRGDGWQPSLMGQASALTLQSVRRRGPDVHLSYRMGAENE